MTLVVEIPDQSDIGIQRLWLTDVDFGKVCMDRIVTKVGKLSGVRKANPGTMLFTQAAARL